MRFLSSGETSLRWGQPELGRRAAAARAVLAGHVGARVGLDGAVRDRCRSRIFESALTLRLLRLERVHPEAQDRIVRYLDAENRRRFQALVASMSEKLRTTFVLFEIEGYSGEEIAHIHDVPLGTVWTRLHLVRKEFWRLLKKQRGDEEPAR